MRIPAAGFRHYPLTAVLAMLAVLVAALASQTATSRAQPEDCLTISPLQVEEVIFPGDSVEITKCVHVPEIPPVVDIYFLADTTFSMEPVIVSVQSDGGNVLAAIDGTGVDARYGAGDYKDFQDPQVDPYAFNNAAPIPGLDDNGAAALAAIAAWSALPGEGGDGPEGQFYALHQLAAHGAASFRSEAAKIVVWFGDAPAHDPVCDEISGDVGHDVTQASLTTELTNAGIKVVAISVVTAAGAFYPNALDDLNTSFSGDYDANCGGDSGDPGQATEIAAATGGVHLTGVAPEDIAAAILAALGEVEVEVTMESTCEDPITTTFDPESQTATGDTSVFFTETISVASDAPGGTYTCRDVARIDGELLTDAEGQVVSEVKTIHVPEGFVTGGGQINSGNGPKAERISFGGNVGFLADFSLVGQWQTNFHNVGIDSLDGAIFHSTEITDLQFSHDGGAGPAPPPANANVAQFTAEGRVKLADAGWEDGWTLEVCLADRGEPGRNNDSILLILTSPGGDVYNSFVVDGSDFNSVTTAGECDTNKLDSGNFQIHSGIQ